MGKLPEITEENWESLASEVAHERYPLGTVVKYFSLYKYCFGKVSSISGKGAITLNCGDLPLEKVTDAGPSSVIFWYNPEGFEEGPEWTDEDGPKSRRFFPHYEDPKYIAGAKKGNIGWSIKKLEIEENGLVKIISHCP